MIKRLSHATFYVLDQDEAKAFYTEKLGFAVTMDVSMEGGFRWLTVSPPDQPGLQIVLMPLLPNPMMDEDTVASLRALVEKGAMGTGVFYTEDCETTYAELKAKGVEFIAPPKKQFYGVEALFKDNSGNWFSLTQPTHE